MKSKAFTLAEIMIVLGVIGVLTAILLPVALHSAPNENVMKFKKGHNALLTAVRELVNSDKYYLDGDLGKKPDGSYVDDTTYLCNTLSDIMSTKEVDCAEVTPSFEPFAIVSEDWTSNGFDATPFTALLDERCKERESQGLINKITTNDNIAFYEAYPAFAFGAVSIYAIYYSKWDKKGNTDMDGGFYYVYKPFCMDIDGIGKGEDPFGYGIRVDGKVLFGTRAQEWLQKSIQEKE